VKPVTCAGECGEFCSARERGCCRTGDGQRTTNAIISHVRIMQIAVSNYRINYTIEKREKQRKGRGHYGIPNMDQGRLEQAERTTYVRLYPFFHFLFIFFLLFS
jgi:hypothetical protein